MRFVSIDLSLANLGMSFGVVEDGKIVPKELKYIDNSSISKRNLKKSNILQVEELVRRSSVLFIEIKNFIKEHNPDVIFGELPSGSQGYSSALSYAITCGILGTIPQEKFIGVRPQEAKIAFTGNGNAEKKDIMDKAFNLFPNLNWYLHKNGTMLLKNEHTADSIAIATAGIEKEKFKKLKNEKS